MSQRAFSLVPFPGAVDFSIRGTVRMWPDRTTTIEGYFPFPDASGNVNAGELRTLSCQPVPYEFKRADGSTVAIYWQTRPSGAHGGYETFIDSPRGMIFQPVDSVVLVFPCVDGVR